MSLFTYAPLCKSGSKNKYETGRANERMKEQASNPHILIKYETDEIFNGIRCEVNSGNETLLYGGFNSGISCKDSAKPPDWGLQKNLVIDIPRPKSSFAARSCTLKPITLNTLAIFEV